MSVPGDVASVPMRLLIWTVMPTHHQSAFFAALRDAGVQVEVRYFDRVSAERQALGWQVPAVLPDGEVYVDATWWTAWRAARPDLGIHVVGGAGHSFTRQLVLALSLRRAPWLHWSEPATPVAGPALRRLLRRAYGQLVNHCALGALAIGDAARDDFRRWGIRDDRIRFLPYSVAPLVPVDAEGAPAPGPRFVQVGELCQRKGVDVLLRAFAGVRAAYPGAHLTLVGQGPQQADYQALARQLGIADDVEFAGAVPAPLVGRAIQRAHVLVLASRFDGWGVVLNEGASLGKALVATDMTGSAAHLIEPGRNGFRVPADDVTALQAALARYCQEPALAAVHGRASAEIFRDYTPAANARRLRLAVASLVAVR